MDELVEAFVAEMKTLSRKGGVIEYPDIFAAALSALSSKGLAVVKKEALRDEARACWEAINEAIPHGELPGDGTDKLAQRNGMILACNIIFDRAFAARPKEGA